MNQKSLNLKTLLFKILIGVFYISIVVTGLISGSAFAQDDEVSEKARARAYPGGKDEDRLQVQPILPEPEKKYTDKAIQNQVLKRPTTNED